MSRGATGFVGMAALAVATLLGFGGGAPDVGTISANVPSIKEIFGQSASVRDWNLHWPSVGVGVAAGILLALFFQISWFELPRNVVRWLIANERNFYRIGVAGVCLAVLIFY
jgi:hypothetical protein